MSRKKIKKEVDDATLLRRLITRQVKDKEEEMQLDPPLSSTDRSALVKEVYDILAPGFFMLLENITINEFNILLSDDEDEEETNEEDEDDEDLEDDEDTEDDDDAIDAEFEEVPNEAA